MFYNKSFHYLGDLGSIWRLALQYIVVKTGPTFGWMFEPVEIFLALVKFTVVHLITFFFQYGWFWQHFIVISGPTLVGCSSLRTAQQKIRKGQVKLASMQSFWTRSSTRWDSRKAIFIFVSKNVSNEVVSQCNDLSVLGFCEQSHSWSSDRQKPGSVRSSR